MKVTGLDGRGYTLKTSGKMPPESGEENKSSLHLRARSLLKGLFPLERRLEEVPLPGTNGLSLDFLLPARRLAAEAQGEQHYEYVPHFHGDRSGFVRSCVRDMAKQRWCELNGIRLVELPYWEDDGEWERRVLGARPP